MQIYKRRKFNNTLKLNNESDNQEENDSKKPNEKSNTSLVLLNETDEKNKKKRHSKIFDYSANIHISKPNYKSKNKNAFLKIA